MKSSVAGTAAMQMSIKFGSVLVAALGVLLVAAIVLFTAFGAADEGRAETRGGFALSHDSSRLAYHYTQVSADAKTIRRGIRIHDTASGQTTIRIDGGDQMHLHSPAFSRDGNSLIFASACWADTCANALRGSRLISVDLSNGSYETLTDDGLETPFWDFGYVNERPESYATQISRSQPIVTQGSVYYLMATADPRSVSTPKDFAPRRLTPQDEFVLQSAGGPVGFRGTGSLAPFGPDKILVLAGAVRGSPFEVATRADKTFAYVLDKTSGRLEMAWAQDDLKKIGISSAVSTETATGTADMPTAYFAAGNDIIAIPAADPQIFHSVQDMKALRIWDLALSGNGQMLLAVVQMPETGVPSLTYLKLDTATKVRTPMEFFYASGKIIKIQ